MSQDIATQAQSWRFELGADGFPGIVDGEGQQILDVIVPNEPRPQDRARADAVAEFVASACRMHADIRADLESGIRAYVENTPLNWNAYQRGRLSVMVDSYVSLFQHSGLDAALYSEAKSLLDVPETPVPTDSGWGVTISATAAGFTYETFGPGLGAAGFEPTRGKLAAIIERTLHTYLPASPGERPSLPARG